jgi:hypothetical protein
MESRATIEAAHRTRCINRFVLIPSIEPVVSDRIADCHLLGCGIASKVSAMSSDCCHSAGRTTSEFRFAASTGFLIESM